MRANPPLCLWLALLSLAWADYTVQVGAFRTEESAEAHVRHLAAKTIPAKVHKLGSWYAVLSGLFAAKEEANRYVQTVKAKGVEAFVKQAPAGFEWQAPAAPADPSPPKLQQPAPPASKTGPDPAEPPVPAGPALLAAATFTETARALELREQLQKQDLFAYVLVREVEGARYFQVVVYAEDGRDALKKLTALGLTARALFPDKNGG